MTTYSSVITNGNLDGRITKQNAEVWHGSNEAQFSLYNTLQNNKLDFNSNEYRMDGYNYSEDLLYCRPNGMYMDYRIFKYIEKIKTNNANSRRLVSLRGSTDLDCYSSLRPMIKFKEAS